MTAAERRLSTPVVSTSRHTFVGQGVGCRWRRCAVGVIEVQCGVAVSCLPNQSVNAAMIVAVVLKQLHGTMLQCDVSRRANEAS